MFPAGGVAANLSANGDMLLEWLDDGGAGDMVSSGSSSGTVSVPREALVGGVGAWYCLGMIGPLIGLTFSQSPIMLGAGPLPIGDITCPYARCRPLGSGPIEAKVSDLVTGAIDPIVSVLEMGLKAAGEVAVGDVGAAALSLLNDDA